VSQSVLAGRGTAASVSASDTLVAFAAATLLLPVCALVGLGLGVLIRHSIATTVVSVVILTLLPQLFTTRLRWTAELHHAMVFSAWQRLTWSYGSPDAVGRLYPPFAESWIVYAAWPLTLLALALVVVRHRDV